MNNTTTVKNVGTEKLADTMLEAVHNYMGHIKDTYADWNLTHASDDVRAYREEMIAEWNNNVHFTVGSKYIGVWTGNSIHSFIVNNTVDKKFAYGGVLKPATWKAPTRNFERGNVFKKGSVAGIAWFGH